MKLLYAFDWSELHRCVSGGPIDELPWPRSYAEQVLAGETNSPIVSAFVDSFEAPTVQIRVNRGGKTAAVVWIDELGRPALKYQFSATGDQGKGSSMFFPDGCYLRPEHMFLTDLQSRMYRTNGHMGVHLIRQYAADGRTRLLRKGFEDDGTPVANGAAVDWCHDLKIDVTSDISGTPGSQVSISKSSKACSFGTDQGSSSRNRVFHDLMCDTTERTNSSRPQARPPLAQAG